MPFALGLLPAPWSELVERREVGKEGGGKKAEWGQRRLLRTCTTLSMISSMLSGRITSDTNCGWEYASRILACRSSRTVPGNLGLRAGEREERKAEGRGREREDIKGALILALREIEAASSGTGTPTHMHTLHPHLDAHIHTYILMYPYIRSPDLLGFV